MKELINRLDDQYLLLSHQKSGKNLTLNNIKLLRIILDPMDQLNVHTRYYGNI